MEFFVIGVSHHQTPVALREKFACIQSNEPRLHQHCSASGVLKELLILSTCNRLEIIGVSPEPAKAHQTIIKALLDITQLSLADLTPLIYEFYGSKAARHLFRVSASLDSLILGEAQILGQVKEAFRQSLRLRSAGPIINKLMHKSFQAAKRVRTETCLAGGAVSVASAAVSLAKTLKGGNLNGAKTLILGAGPMASLAARHLIKRNAQVTIMSRTPEKADYLAHKHQITAAPWGQLSKILIKADIVIAATGAKAPILNLNNVSESVHERAPKSLLIIDIGVPRNVSHDLKRLEAITLRNIDDLNEVVWDSRLSRQNAATKAELIIDEELLKFTHWLKIFNQRPTVTALTKKAEKIRRLELKRTFNQHHFSQEQQKALESMTAAMVRRLLHDPLVFIKNQTLASCAYRTMENLCQKHLAATDCQGCKQDAGHLAAHLTAIERLFNLKPDEAATDH
ncbi:MAG: glutamyl-tRNA reductase [Candidatus Adiutrix sp.]